MENFDVVIVSKDIIDGKPMASCVVTHDNQFIATVKYDYFSAEPKLEFLNVICIPDEERIGTGKKRLDAQIKLSVLQYINSKTLFEVDRRAFYLKNIN